MNPILALLIVLGALHLAACEWPGKASSAVLPSESYFLDEREKNSTLCPKILRFCDQPGGGCQVLIGIFGRDEVNSGWIESSPGTGSKRRRIRFDGRRLDYVRRAPTLPYPLRLLDVFPGGLTFLTEAEMEIRFGKRSADQAETAVASGLDRIYYGAFTCHFARGGSLEKGVQMESERHHEAYLRSVDQDTNGSTYLFQSETGPTGSLRLAVSEQGDVRYAWRRPEGEQVMYEAKISSDDFLKFRELVTGLSNRPPYASSGEECRVKESFALFVVNAKDGPRCWRWNRQSDLALLKKMRTFLLISLHFAVDSAPDSEKWPVSPGPDGSPVLRPSP